jgi:hypothetical protein
MNCFFTDFRSRDLQVTVAKQQISAIRRDLKVTATKRRGLCRPHRSLRRAAVFGVWRGFSVRELELTATRALSEINFKKSFCGA